MNPNDSHNKTKQKRQLRIENNKNHNKQDGEIEFGE